MIRGSSNAKSADHAYDLYTGTGTWVEGVGSLCRLEFLDVLTLLTWILRISIIYCRLVSISLIIFS